MVLDTIYVVRHGYRSNWVVDTQTGTYHSPYPTPTGIPSDPALASYGVLQAEQLATHLMTVDPPADQIYSSPFYRCIQTLSPFTNKLVESRGAEQVRVVLEPGVGEFYGLARFDHPSPASIDVLSKHFPHLHAEPSAIIVPSTRGESISQLHDRIAYCLHRLIERADRDPRQPRSLLICSHAAAMIAIGRALTGRMPEDISEDDFQCFTCSFSKFTRRNAQGPVVDVAEWSPSEPEDIPDVQWRSGRGVMGGWNCEINGDCSFLSGGEERGWRFSGDESFLADPNAFNDSRNTTKDSNDDNDKSGSGSRL